jgi:uncharacterized protein (UPF0261 family)
MVHGGNVDDRHVTGPSSILVIGTMDTKAAEVRFLRDRIAAAGARSLVLDVSTSGGAGGEAEVTADDVARHHPEGQPFHDPGADAALFRAVEENDRQTDRRHVIRLPYHINDAAVAMAAAHELENMMHEVEA